MGIFLHLSKYKYLHFFFYDQGFGEWRFWKACSGMFSLLHAVCLFPRLPSKSLPHLPGTPRPTSSLPPGPVKAIPAQVRPPSPGNIRPVKREVRVEPERKDPEKEPQKVANELPLKGRTPLVKVEEATVEEGTSGETEDASGKNQPTCGGI